MMMTTRPTVQSTAGLVAKVPADGGRLLEILRELQGDAASTRSPSVSRKTLKLSYALTRHLSLVSRAGADNAIDVFYNFFLD